ncbi:hypothetical protein AB1398_00345, partial [Hydrogenibacillus schlegelii]
AGGGRLSGGGGAPGGGRRRGGAAPPPGTAGAPSEGPLPGRYGALPAEAPDVVFVRAFGPETAAMLKALCGGRSAEHRRDRATSWTGASY